MKIEQVALAKLKPYGNNPRKNAAAVPVVRRIIEEVGFRQPIVVDKDYVIVVGHTRFLAAKEMGLKTVPVHVASDLTPAQIKAYRIADNKASEHAEWDDTKLIAELAGLATDFPDLSALGFTAEEIAALNAPDKPLPLEDFETMPVEGQGWILVRGTTHDCALALSAMRKLKLKAHIEYSGDKAKGA